jgi:hypothetical protein
MDWLFKDSKGKQFQVITLNEEIVGEPLVWVPKLTRHGSLKNFNVTVEKKSKNAHLLKQELDKKFEDAVKKRKKRLNIPITFEDMILW